MFYLKNEKEKKNFTPKIRRPKNENCDLKNSWFKKKKKKGM